MSSAHESWPVSNASSITPISILDPRLELDTRAKNALALGGYDDIAAVAATDWDNLCDLRMVGPDTLRIIRRAVLLASVMTPRDRHARPERQPDHSHLADYRLDDPALRVPAPVVTALSRADVTTMAQVADLTLAQLRSIEGITPRRAVEALNAVRRAERLASVPAAAASDLAAAGAVSVSDLRFLLPADLVSLAGDEVAARLESFRAGAVAFRRREDDKFVEMVGVLRRFVAQYGHAVPVRSEVFEGRSIGKFVATQRVAYLGADGLSTARRLVLEAQPFWTWHSKDEGHLVRTGCAASEVLERVRDFAAIHGHTTTGHGRSMIDLHHALARLREAGAYVKPEVRAQFDALPGWTWDQSEADRMTLEMSARRLRDAVVIPKWQHPFMRLEAFVAEFGHARVPRRFVDETGFKMGEWVANVRKSRDTLDPWQRDAVEALPGWDWMPRKTRGDTSFFRHCGELREYVRDNGRLPESDHRTKDGFPLGDWMARTSRLGDTLSADRRVAIETVPGWTWSSPYGSRVLEPHLRAKFAARLRLLSEYLATFGSVPTIDCIYQDVPLGKWCASMRAQYRAGTLHPERQAALDAVAGWSWFVSPGRPGHRSK